MCVPLHPSTAVKLDHFHLLAFLADGRRLNRTCTGMVVGVAGEMEVQVP